MKHQNGRRFNVELEVLLPPDMTVMESHDIGQELQHKVYLYYETLIKVLS